MIFFFCLRRTLHPVCVVHLNQFSRFKELFFFQNTLYVSKKKNKNGQMEGANLVFPAIKNTISTLIAALLDFRLLEDTISISM